MQDLDFRNCKLVIACSDTTIYARRWVFVKLKIIPVGLGFIRESVNFLGILTTAFKGSESNSSCINDFT